MAGASEVANNFMVEEKAMTPDQATTVNDYERLVEWFRDPQRKDPSLAFTAGPARTAAMAFVDSGVAVEIQRLRAALADCISGLRYIEETHGRLSGVGWDRVLGYWELTKGGAA
jgi:hypothetical protein